MVYNVHSMLRFASFFVRVLFAVISPSVQSVTDTSPVYFRYVLCDSDYSCENITYRNL